MTASGTAISSNASSGTAIALGTSNGLSGRPRSLWPTPALSRRPVPYTSFAIGGGTLVSKDSVLPDEPDGRGGWQGPEPRRRDVPVARVLHRRAGRLVTLRAPPIGCCAATTVRGSLVVADKLAGLQGRQPSAFTRGLSCEALDRLDSKRPVLTFLRTSPALNTRPLMQTKMPGGST
jgi:hypothetical protein